MEQYATSKISFVSQLQKISVLADIRLPHSNLMAPDEMKNLGFDEENRPLDEQNQAKHSNTDSVTATRSKMS